MPTFDLRRSGGGFLLGTRVDGIAAPGNAVDWLELEARPGSSGVVRAYRVNTVLGKPPANCAGQRRDFLVDYAALYWLYGEVSKGIATT